MDRDALFHDNLTWAEGLARSVARKLPPSFDRDDLMQIARIEHWKRTTLYDPEKNDTYRGYAYLWIVNAVRMATRRKEYTAATAEELSGREIDQNLNPEQLVEALEEFFERTEKEQAQREQLRYRARAIGPAEAYLVDRVEATRAIPSGIASIQGRARLRLFRRELNHVKASLGDRQHHLIPGEADYWGERQPNQA